MTRFRARPRGTSELRPHGRSSRSTDVALTDRLPLSCSRAGTCCFGNQVWLNPWELARLAAARGQTPRDFRNGSCDVGGIRLRFDGAPGWKGLPACNQYAPGRGCSVYSARPLACRLYPLGRERRGDEIHYTHEGTRFPCLEGCPEVAELPHRSVADYLTSQDVRAGETAHDAYLELMQRLADGAFVLLLESGLAATGDRLTLQGWRELGRGGPAFLADQLGGEWLDRLMLPGLEAELDDPAAFAQRHHDLLQRHAQSSFGRLNDPVALRDAARLMMALALYLGCGLGADSRELAEQWIATATRHGAAE